MKTTYSRDEKNITIEEKLRALHDLQSVVSDVDKIKTLRGELPLEVQDLEDDITGLKTRLTNLDVEIKNLDTIISNKKIAIKDSQALITKYTEQQNNVRNNREFDSLSKEIEFQNLEIELSDKRIKEFTVDMKEKKETVSTSKTSLKEREEDLVRKKSELKEITEETKIEEEKLKSKSEKIESFIEPRLLTAFKRIRKNARNGLAVVTIQRNACGGCFNKIPPQRQMDIANRKKIIVCEYCGRILVDPKINVLEEDAVKK